MEPSEAHFSDTTIDLSNCDREPIHIPGKIQPFGFLLAVDIHTLTVTQCSNNTGEHIGILPQAILGRPLSDLLADYSLAQIKTALANEQLAFINPIELEFQNRSSYQSVLHIRQQGVLIIECETEGKRYLQSTDYYSTINHLMQSLKACHRVPDLCDMLARNIRRITSYDRVMVYRFDEEWNGKVIAESRRLDLHSFYGHHFPSTDIPVQARKLYLTNMLRMIPNVDYVPVELVPQINPQTKEMLDLSNSFLRSVSPIHVEYLQNMGVKATLVISIIIHDKLWGLLTCHHYSVKFIDSRLRMLLEHVGSLAAYQIEMVENSSAQQHYLKVQSYEKEIIKHIARERNLITGLSYDLSLLLKLNSASGVIIWWENNSSGTGLLPPKEVVREIVNWLFIHHSENIFYTDCLKKYFPIAEKYVSIASGILAIRLSKYEKRYIIWFKPETIQTIAWGGNPAEKVLLMPEDDGFRLSPRKSFAKWEETVRNRAVKWEHSEIQQAHNFRNFLIEQIANQSAQLERQNMELNLKVEEKVLEIKKAYVQLQNINEELACQNEELRVQSEEIAASHHRLQIKEQQLKAIFDNTRHVLFFLDIHANILFFNRMAQHNAQLLHGRDLTIGESMKNYFRTDEELAAFEEVFQQTVKGKSFVMEHEFFHEVFAPSRSFRVEYNPVYEEMQVIGVTILMIDITDIKKYATYIEKQNEVLKDIAYIQSHEIRRPVANIMGLLNIFNYDDLHDPFNKEVMDKLHVSITQLDEMIHQIVDKTYLIEEFERENTPPPTP
jgi:PAS domain S-box-containing protein